MPVSPTQGNCFNLIKYPSYLCWFISSFKDQISHNLRDLPLCRSLRHKKIPTISSKISPRHVAGRRCASPRFLFADRHTSARTPPTSRAVTSPAHLSTLTAARLLDFHAINCVTNRAVSGYHFAAQRAADRAAAITATAQIVRG